MSSNRIAIRAICAVLLLVMVGSRCPAVAQVLGKPTPPGSKEAAKSQDEGEKKGDLQPDIRFNEGAIGQDLDEVARKLHSRLADRISRANPCPADRLKYYDTWINPPKSPSRKSPVIGWWGSIVQATRQGNDWVVQVSVSPRFDHGGTLITNRDALYIETYVLSNNDVTFREAKLPPPSARPRIMTWN